MTHTHGLVNVVESRRIWRSLCLSAAAVLFLPLPVVSQASAPDKIILQTEQAGAAHPRATRSRALSEEWGPTHWQGTSDRKCIEASGMGPVRSGEFIIGGELGGSQRLLPRVPAKIWWAPLHNSERMEPLRVQGTRLSSPMQMDTVFRDVARPTAPGSLYRIDPEYFFPSGTVLPDWGRWLIVASSGANWGCFILTSGRG